MRIGAHEKGRVVSCRHEMVPCEVDDLLHVMHTVIINLHLTDMQLGTYRRKYHGKYARG